MTQRGKTQPQQRVTYEEAVDALAALNERKHTIGHHTPTEVTRYLYQKALEDAKGAKVEPLKRNTISTMLLRMARYGLLAQVESHDAGAFRGTFGYRYGLLGTPAEDAPYNAKQANALHDTNVRRAVAYLDQRRPRHPAARKHALAPGRVTKTFTVNRSLYMEVETITRGEGVPLKDVLDHVLRAYRDSHQGITRDPHQAVLRRFPPISQPRPNGQQNGQRAAVG